MSFEEEFRIHELMVRKESITEEGFNLLAQHPRWADSQLAIPLWHDIFFYNLTMVVCPKIELTSHVEDVYFILPTL